MDDKLQGAVDVLLEELAEQEKQSAETKRTINALMRRMGKSPMFDDVTVNDNLRAKVRADEYYTKPLATAVTMFLQRRREPVTTQEILKGLVQGGFEFKGWKEEDRLRLLASSMGKNTKYFHRVPSGAFGLVEWYNLEDHKQEELETNTEGHKPAVKKAAAGAAHSSEIPVAEGKSNGQEKSK
jgi:hypothetical protein